MRVYLKKFGTTLISRQSGREAFAAFRPRLEEVSKEEVLEIDFEGVVTFSPSWGDEFLSPLFKQFKERLILINTDNPSVRATLELLEEIQSIPPRNRI